MASPGAPRLVLVPTALERRRLEALGGWPLGCALVHEGGFGPVAAAARASQLVARLQPRSVLLVGIAGTYAAEVLPVGAAACFDVVTLDGVGAGEGATLAPPSTLGFPQWPSGPGGEPVFEELPLVVPPGIEPAGRLVTACAAAASAAQARERAARFLAAAAEDMEAFGVALACALTGTPLTVVRGISNAVGERDPRRWEVDAALAAARTLALEVLAADGGARR